MTIRATRLLVRQTIFDRLGRRGFRRAEEGEFNHFLTINGSPPTLSLTVDSAEIDVPYSTDALTLNGDLGGAGPLVKTGDGEAIMTGDITLAGDMTVAAGVLRADEFTVSGNVYVSGTLIADSCTCDTLVIGVSLRITVPEPSGIAMLLAAAGSVAFIGRRRKQRQSVSIGALTIQCIHRRGPKNVPNRHIPRPTPIHRSLIKPSRTATKCSWNY